MKVAIINYGIGNLASVRRAFEDIGATPSIANHPSALFEADRLVLPGVGAFSEGMRGLAAGGWIEPLRDAVNQHGKPLLGICLGMQMLGAASHEMQTTDGLGLVPGEVHRLDALGCSLRIPHVGWNEVVLQGDSDLFHDIPDRSDFYFVHSYALVPSPENLLATTPYGCDIAAAVRHGHVFGCQFHPEKSSRAGRQLLSNFLDYVPC